MPTESTRVLELRRRVEADPASTAFAQLAEEYHRLGEADAAVACCRAGLETHPNYLSARVILGRALATLGRLDEAAHEFDIVLRSAPDNLAALKGMADIERRRGGAPAVHGQTSPTPPSALAAGATSVDFDAILRHLGAPNLSPPPQTAALIEAIETRPTGSPVTASDAAEEARSLEITPPGSDDAPLAPSSEDANVLAELEAWLSALQHPR